MIDVVTALLYSDSLMKMYYICIAIGIKIDYKSVWLVTLRESYHD